MTKGFFVKKDWEEEEEVQTEGREVRSNGRGDLCTKHAHAFLGNI